MSNFKIQIDTLTQVHIGGESSLLNKGMDFIVDNDEEGSYIAILNVEKVTKLIEKKYGHLDTWISVIERGEAEKAEKIIKEVLSSQEKINECSTRIISNYSDFSKTNGTLKECLHDGSGRPYIPGSSLKGAIRTIILSEMLKRDINKGEKKKIILEKAKNPFSIEDDPFRQISVGDAYFEEGDTWAVKQVNLNITKHKKIKDETKPQAVEAIAEEKYAKSRLIVKPDFYSKVGVESIEELLKIINKHTEDLINKEISFWTDFDDSDVYDYINNLKQIIERVNSCKSGTECVIRIGQASGWRFITGAWAEELDDYTFKEEIVSKCRREKFYDSYDFPKSRRIDTEESKLFGFIKISIINTSSKLEQHG